jgi:4-hydroxybenzoate polyprenyltransferase
MGELSADAGPLAKLRLVLDNIKFQHTIFALPFCLMAFAYAAYPGPGLDDLILVILAMVFARTAAMSYNRYVDADVDAANPRTKGRPVPSGRLSRGAVLAWTIGSAALFVVVAGLINLWALALSPVALAIVLGYSHSKRFTSLSHLWLGAALGVAPIGGWIAADQLPWSPVPWLISAAVVLWVAGFDIIYATQDEDFDRRWGLHSLVTRLGLRGALVASKVLHSLAVACLVILGLVADRLGPVYLMGAGIAAACLLYEQHLVRAEDLSQVNVAFFTMNGIVGIVLCAATIADIYWW